jgi:predicted alpha/beta superfamily hydrolase
MIRFISIFGLFTILAVGPGSGLAASPDREIVSFVHTNNVGFGTNVHVVGSHPDVGAWAPVNSLKLRWTTGNVWTGLVAVQKGTTLEYKFIARSFASNLFCDANNVVWEPGSNRSVQIAAAPGAPYNGKTVYYYSGWTSATLLVISGTNTPSYPMTRIGQGRATNEWLYRASGIGTEGEWLEFVPNGFFNGAQFWDNPPPPETNLNYITRLDAFLLQDGNIFNYWPATTVSAQRKEMRSVGSSYAPPIDGRTINIILPRGYDSHPWKRYPVIYFQDGQNITNGADAFGNGAWDADVSARRETAAGRMREAILVGIYNYPERRRWEYNPPTDTYPGELAGRADAYLNFLVNNVRPTLDVNYRTLNDPRNTMVAGSSMGGIFSIYAGLETNVFGGVLAMSPAVTRAPNYRNSIPSKNKRPANIYIDTGTAENQVGTLPGGYYWDDPWTAYDHLQSIGYVPNLDIMMRAGCGHAHNEAAWRARLPDAFRFLLDARDEPNRIAQLEWPPVISGQPSWQFIPFSTQRQFRYQIETTSNGVWMPEGLIWIETNAWDYRTLPITNAPQSYLWMRVSSTPAD